MSKIVRVQDGDYRLITQNNGTITLDTGNQVGQVVVTGDLLVKGNTTTVQSETLTIRDNIIYLNQDEVGAGVTLDRAGISIERGSLPDANIWFDETYTYTTPTGIVNQGVWTFPDAGGNSIALQFNVLQTNGGDLRINTGVIGDGAISVSQVPDYELRVTDDDDIPNKKWINDYVAAYGGSALVDNFYRFDSGTSTPYNTGGRAYDTAAGDGVSRIDFEVDGTLKVSMQSSGMTVDSVKIGSSTVTTTFGSTATLSLTSDANQVDVDAILTLQNQASAPSSTSGRNKVYANSTIGTGGTGLYFVNTTTDGELISSKKALLYALLF